MRTNEIFSVIIPTYNRSQDIVRSLDSISHQTYRPIEVIVVDDGSNDGTDIVVENWVKINQEEGELSIKYFYQENNGPSSARNYGIKKISGEYIQFLDSDDLLSPNRFEILVDLFKNPEVDFIQTGFYGFIQGTNKVVDKHYGRPDESQVELALKGCLWANTLRSSFKRTLVDRIEPWNTEMLCFEDRLYVENAVVQANKPIAIPDVLAAACRSGSNRVSDRQSSYSGRKCRVYCERKLAESAINRINVSYAAKQEFASRIYALGFRSNASGWLDLGRECGEIAGSVEVELDSKGRLRRFVWKAGRMGGLIYDFLGRSKRIIAGTRKRFKTDFISLR